MSRSLEKALNRDYKDVLPNALYNVQNLNHMKAELNDRLRKIVNEELVHTAGGQTIKSVPYYSQISGGCTHGSCPQLWERNRMSGGYCGGSEEDLYGGIGERFAIQAPVAPYYEGLSNPRRIQETEAARQRRLDLPLAETPVAQTARLKREKFDQQQGLDYYLRNRGMSRAAVTKELLKMRSQQKDYDKANKFAKGIELHLDESAADAENQINRARIQSEFNSPGGVVPAYYFEQVSKSHHPLGPISEKPMMVKRMLLNKLNRSKNDHFNLVKNRRGRRGKARGYLKKKKGASFFGDIGKTFKTVFSKAGDILTNTPLKYIPGIDTVGKVYKGIGSIGDGMRRRKRGGVMSPKTFGIY